MSVANSVFVQFSGAPIPGTDCKKLRLPIDDKTNVAALKVLISEATKIPLAHLYLKTSTPYTYVYPGDLDVGNRSFIAFLKDADLIKTAIKTHPPVSGGYSFPMTTIYSAPTLSYSYTAARCNDQTHCPYDMVKT